MKSLRWIATLVAALGVALGVAAVTTAHPTYQPPTLYTLGVLRPTAFTSNGDLINGWYWLRNSGSTAEWTFDVRALQGIAKSNDVYLNVAALATKGVNGAAGYSAGLSLRYVGLQTASYYVTLVNPFRPRETSLVPMKPTNGVGYQVYGAGLVPKSGWNGATTMKVIASRTGGIVTQNIHVAVSKDAVLIAYVK